MAPQAKLSPGSWENVCLVIFYLLRQRAVYDMSAAVTPSQFHSLSLFLLCGRGGVGRQAQVRPKFPPL